MSEKPKVKLFREKSLEAVESPESLNDYLRVTSPGFSLIDCRPLPSAKLAAIEVAARLT